MKKQGERFRQIRELLGMSRVDMGALIDVSPQTIQNIENGDKMASLPNAVQRLGIRMDYINTGKGPMFLTGTDEENVARIKSMKSGTQSGAEPWKDEAYQNMKTELDRAREREDRMQRIIDRLLNGANFRKAPDYTSLKLASGF